MKKNITINLFGTLYNIDEDAYLLLDNYLNSMKRYFGSKDGNIEIADDIENRVAELLWEKKEHGMEAVNLDVIKEIIGKIGNIEDIAGYDNDEGNASSDDNTNANTNRTCDGSAPDDEGYDQGDNSMWQRTRRHFRHRFLYRDPDNSILGGVCSGMANYTGFGDPVLWRLLMLLTTLFNGIGLLLYIVLWIIVPLAQTPEDKLRMKGMRVTPDNLNRQILQEHSGTPQSTRTTLDNGQSCASGCLKALLAVFVILPLGIVLLVFMFVTAVVFGALSMSSSCGTCTSDMPWLPYMMNDFWTYAGIVSFAAVLPITLFLLIRWIFSTNSRMSRRTIKVLVGTLVVSLIVSVFSISRTVTRIATDNNDKGNYHITINNGKLTNINRSDYSQPDKDKPYMEQSGFTIVQNNTTRCTWNGDYPTGDKSRRYLDANDDNMLLFTAERTDTLDAGTYTLSALVRANKEGACIYVKRENWKRTTSIPASGNHHGNLWKWACGKNSDSRVEHLYPEFATDSIRKSIADTNSGKGFGWCVVSIPNIKLSKREAITYGISTDPAITGSGHYMSSWVSATDFVLIKTTTGKKK